MFHSRRHFLLGTGSAVALSSLPLSISARTRLQQHSGSKGLVVYREALEYGRNFASVMVAAGMDAVALGGDPVQQWRRQLAEIVASSPVPVYGLTDWSDYQLLRGLCAELRRHPASETAHRGSLAGSADWAGQLALDLLDGKAVAPRTAAGQHTLFTWVIS